MKRIFYSLVIAGSLIPFLSFGQITMEQSDFKAQLGNTIKYEWGITTQYTPGSAGAHQTWDFSKLSTHAIDSNLKYESQFPASAEFPTANIRMPYTMPYTTNNKLYNYFLLDSTGFYSLGLHLEIKTIDSSYEGVLGIRYKTGLRSVPLPLSFNSSDISSSARVSYFLDTIVGQDTAYLNGINKLTSTCDAWGTLITPEGKSYDALRMWQIESAIDTLKVKDTLGAWHSLVVHTEGTDTTYYWFAKDVGYLASMKKSVGNASWSYNFYTTAQQPSSSIVSVDDNKVPIMIYPNPAGQRLVVKSAGNLADYTIINALGQIILRGSLQSNRTIDLSDMPAGLYSIQIVHQQRFFSSLRFVKK